MSLGGEGPPYSTDKSGRNFGSFACCCDRNSRAPERSGKSVGTVLRDGLKETEVNILSACDEEQKVESITDSQTPN